MYTLGLYRDNGQENGNYYRGYIGVKCIVGKSQPGSGNIWGFYIMCGNRIA